MESNDVIYETSKRLYQLSKSPAVSEGVSAELTELAGNLETSEHCLYEGVYGDLCDMITPHIKPDHNGLSSCSEDSLTCSVVESFQFLLEFWLENRSK